MKTTTQLRSTLERHQFSPIQNLTPRSLSQALESFHRGILKPAVLLWETMEHRDDLLQGVIAKRKKSVARLHWEILTLDHSEESLQQKRVLEHFYNTLKVENAFDQNEQGGFSMLIRQMMDAVGKHYAVHELIFTPKPEQKLVEACFRFVPLWFFENTTGRLRFDGERRKPFALERGSWMVTTGDGLMESCSIAYLFKHLPLKDWLIYCERNGMPGVKGVTRAQPGSEEWEVAKEAVENFGAEFTALMTEGSSLEAIDLSARGELPYPRLVDRMDRAMAALWRGSDLATISKKNGTGASLQDDETSLLEEEEDAHLSETLNLQIDNVILEYLFGTQTPKAYLRLKPRQAKNLQADIQLYRQLWEMGLPLSIPDLQEHFSLTPPNPDEAILQK